MSMKQAYMRADLELLQRRHWIADGDVVGENKITQS